MLKFIFLGAVLYLSSANALELLSFRTPSNNIHCMYISDPDDGIYLRCDVMNYIGEHPKMPDCDLDYGDSVSMGVSGRANWTCHGDTVANNGRILKYGETWSKSGFTCTSLKTGLLCQNLNKRGFMLSRQKISLL